MLSEYRETLKQLKEALDSGRFTGQKADLLRGMIRDVAWVIEYIRNGAPLRLRFIRVAKDKQLTQGPRRSLTQRSRFKEMRAAALRLRSLLATQMDMEEARKQVLKVLEEGLSRPQLTLLYWIAQGLDEHEISRLHRRNRAETEKFIEKTLTRAREVLEAHADSYGTQVHSDT